MVAREIMVPGWMTDEQVASAFAAYLLGYEAFDHGDKRMGPYQRDGKWQLDHGNDFWLRLKPASVPGEAREGQVSCRYQSQEYTVYYMAALFMLRYPLDRKRG